MIICKWCGHLASWNSYFGAYYCSMCGDYFVPDVPQYDLCKDNMMCCDDDCQKCANRIYQQYMKLKQKEKDTFDKENDNDYR